MLVRTKAARCATVAAEGFDRMVQRTLHLGVKLFVFKFFTGNPFGGCYQGRLALEMVHIPIPNRSSFGGVGGIQRHDGVKYVQRGLLAVIGFQNLLGGFNLLSGYGDLGKLRCNQRQACG